MLAVGWCLLLYAACCVYGLSFAGVFLSVFVVCCSLCVVHCVFNATRRVVFVVVCVGRCCVLGDVSVASSLVVAVVCCLCAFCCLVLLVV